MGLVEAVLIGATVINAAKNLWELTFMLGDDPAKERTYKYQGNYDFNKSQVKHYHIETRGGKITSIDPLG